jgi:hypothetical protein
MFRNKLPIELLDKILLFLIEPKNELPKWINPDDLDFYQLSSNPCAMDLLARFPKKINFQQLSLNSSAFKLFKRYPKKMDLTNVQFNTNPDILALYLEKIDASDAKNISFLSHNTCPLASKYLRDHQNHINWSNLSANSSDEAVALLLENSDKIVWSEFVSNTNEKAMKFLEANLDIAIPNLSVGRLACNSSDIALYILLDVLGHNTDTLDWDSLSCNSNDRAIATLRENYDMINWYHFSSNKNDMAIDMILEKIYFESTPPYKMDWLGIFCESFKMLDTNDLNWDKLCQNKNPRIIKVIQEILSLLVVDDDARGIFLNKRLWYSLSENPHIFSLNMMKYEEELVSATEFLGTLI